MNQLFKKSVAAGVMISIATTVYLSTSKELGAILFSLGLYAICSFNMTLFTGKVGYCKADLGVKTLAFIWLGNLIGCFLFSMLIHLGYIDLSPKAIDLVIAKISINPLSNFCKAIPCGMLMYLAVDNYKYRDSIQGVFGIIMCVSIFILCGFEHCIADMAYVCIGRVFTLKSLLLLIVVTLGNAAGALTMRYLTDGQT